MPCPSVLQCGLLEHPVKPYPGPTWMYDLCLCAQVSLKRNLSRPLASCLTSARLTWWWPPVCQDARQNWWCYRSMAREAELTGSSTMSRIRLVSFLCFANQMLNSCSWSSHTSILEGCFTTMSRSSTEDCKCACSIQSAQNDPNDPCWSKKWSGWWFGTWLLFS